MRGNPHGMMQIPRAGTAGLLTFPTSETVKVESSFWNPGKGGLCELAVEQKFKVWLGMAYGDSTGEETRKINTWTELSSFFLIPCGCSPIDWPQ